jgi:hypothetical protein
MACRSCDISALIFPVPSPGTEISAILRNHPARRKVIGLTVHNDMQVGNRRRRIYRTCDEEPISVTKANLDEIRMNSKGFQFRETSPYASRYPLLGVISKLCNIFWNIPMSGGKVGIKRPFIVTNCTEVQSDRHRVWRSFTKNNRLCLLSKTADELFSDTVLSRVAAGDTL